MQWRLVKFGIILVSGWMLTGCQQLSTAREWWEAYSGPASVSLPSTASPQKVVIDVTAIARLHPAWQLAETLESQPPRPLSLSWHQPQIPAIQTAASSIVAPPHINGLPYPTFNRQQQRISATAAQTLASQIFATEKGLIAEWASSANSALESDRQNIARVMRVDLRDRIQQTRKNIPEMDELMTPSTEIQSEMIHLRLQLLNNIILTPSEETAAKARLRELENQWIQTLRQQAQQSAEEQQYWRETVPQQMREEGKENIQQTIDTLAGQDHQIITSIVSHQYQQLQHDNNQRLSLALTLPAVDIPWASAKSTFRAPQSLTKATLGSFNSVQPPKLTARHFSAASPLAIHRLKQIALQAAQQTARQSAARHHWKWTSRPSPNLRNVTQIVGKESNF